MTQIKPELFNIEALPMKRKRPRSETHRVIICTTKMDVKLALWRIEWLEGGVLWIPIEGHGRRKPKRYRNIASAQKAIDEMIGTNEYHGPHNLENYVDAPGHEAFGIFRPGEFYLGEYKP